MQMLLLLNFNYQSVFKKSCNKYGLQNMYIAAFFATRLNESIAMTYIFFMGTFLFVFTDKLGL